MNYEKKFNAARESARPAPIYEAATLTNPSAAVQEHHAWRYDKIGNRTSRQNGPQITQTTHNNRNQIVSEQPGGWMRVRSTTDDPPPSA